MKVLDFDIRKVVWKLVLFSCALYVLVLLGFWLIAHLQNSQGLPAIELNVRRQLNTLVVQSPQLKGLSVGTQTGRHAQGFPPLVTGYFIYEAQWAGSSKDLYVYWKENSTNCQLTKIESRSKYSDPQILWEQP